MPSPAIASVLTPTTIPGVTPSITSGLPALPMPTIMVPLMPTSALNTPVQSTTRALVITTSKTSAAPTPAACPMPSRSTLPPPNLHSSPCVVKSLSTTTHSFESARRTTSPAVGPYMAAYCSLLTSHSIPAPLSDIGAPGSGSCRKPREAHAASSASVAPGLTTSPGHRLLPPDTFRAPPMATRVTVLLSPGSKRTAVPAAMCSRMPCACARSKRSLAFASEKWKWLPT
mmetsp:Transcript_4792/g.16712  ORF Transcript_4792/g.16712 Transcript_4792/m.16712 type:complete len:229 (+) Transcript_4792:1350-2036(+)